jgi:hypothetical protein
MVALVPSSRLVPRWANSKLIFELLVPHPISLAIRTSMQLVGVCLKPGFYWRWLTVL